MNDLSERWRQVGIAVVRAREALGLSQADLVRRSNVSDPIVRRIERGQVANYRVPVLRRIEDALGWPIGSITQMVNGPQDSIVPPRPDDVAALRARVDELQDQLLALTARVEELGALQGRSSGRSSPTSPGSP